MLFPTSSCAIVGIVNRLLFLLKTLGFTLAGVSWQLFSETTQADVNGFFCFACFFFFFVICASATQRNAGFLSQWNPEKDLSG